MRHSHPSSESWGALEATKRQQQRDLDAYKQQLEAVSAALRSFFGTAEGRIVAGFLLDRVISSSYLPERMAEDVAFERVAHAEGERSFALKLLNLGHFKYREAIHAK